jgi:hypothetical protein
MASRLSNMCCVVCAVWCVTPSFQQCKSVSEISAKAHDAINICGAIIQANCKNAIAGLLNLLTAHVHVLDLPQSCCSWCYCYHMSTATPKLLAWRCVHVWTCQSATALTGLAQRSKPSCLKFGPQPNFQTSLGSTDHWPAQHAELSELPSLAPSCQTWGTWDFTFKTNRHDRVRASRLYTPMRAQSTGKYILLGQHPMLPQHRTASTWYLGLPFRLEVHHGPSFSYSFSVLG